MNELSALDRAVFIYLNNLGNTKLDSLFLFISSKYFIFIPVFIFLFTNQNKEKIGIKMIFLFLLILIVDQSISQFFKPFFQRLRPCYNVNLVGLVRIVGNCGGKFSFFSAHAANSMVFAWFLIRFFEFKKTISLLLVFWAIIVSYSRIYLGVHYPIDVVFGLFYGFLISEIGFNLYVRKKNFKF